MFDVYFYEAFHEESAAMRRCLPNDVQAGFTPKTIQESNDTEPPASVISVRTQSILPVEWANRLRGILTRSTGYDHIIDFRVRSARRLAAGWLPLYCSRAVAEHALILVMALLRRLPLQMRQFHSFHRDSITGRECLNRRLLVVGVGNIGGETVRLSQAMGMETRGIDLVRKHDFVNYTTLEESLGWAEVIVCAMNLTAENQGYFDYATLKNARAGLVFVNISRGELSPSSDLLRLINEGHLGGIGLDVYSHESELAVALRGNRSSADPKVQAVLALAQRPDVLLTPHNAFNTEESVERKAAQSVQQIAHFLRHGTFLWPVP